MSDTQSTAVDDLFLGPTDLVVLGRYPKARQQALLQHLQTVRCPYYISLVISLVITAKTHAKLSVVYTDMCNFSRPGGDTLRQGKLGD